MSNTSKPIESAQNPKVCTAKLEEQSSVEQPEIARNVANCIHCNSQFTMSPYKVRKHYRVCDSCVKTNRQVRKNTQSPVRQAALKVLQAQTVPVPTAVPVVVDKDDFGGKSKLDAERQAIAAESVSRKTVVQPQASANGVGKYVAQNGEIEELETAIKCGLHTLLTGPTGCGKTHLVQHVAAKMGREYMEVPSCGTYEKIVAKETLVESNGVTITKQQKAVLALAMEKGALLYIDEPNAVATDALFCMFSSMDDRGHIAFDNGEILKAKEGFVVIGAMNEGYAGTNNLNKAFRSRTANIIDMEYLPQARESKMLVERTGIDKETADKLTKMAKALRLALTARTIATPIGTRALISCCKLVVEGLPIAQAIRNTIINQAEGNKVNERKAISDVVAAHFGNGAK